MSSQESSYTDATDHMAFEAPTQGMKGSPDVEQNSCNQARITKHPPLIVSAPRELTICQRRALNAASPLPALAASSQYPPSTGSPNSTPPPTQRNTPLNSDVRSDRFNIFNALLNYPELTLEMSKHLFVDDLISLYAISREFHAVANRRFTNLIYAHARQHAPEASKIFIHRCFKSLCVKDPAGRTIGFSVSKKDRPADGASRTQTGQRYDDIRLVPSFRWLQMVIHRETVVDDIICSLALEGHRLPPETSLMLNKLWFTIDIADNKRRIGIIHNERFWTKLDLFVAATFFLKLDMCFTDPIYGSAQTGMRKMLLNQRTLSVLAGVLEREEVRDEYELLQMFLEHKSLPNRPLPRRSLFGVSVQKMGLKSREGRRRNGSRLIGPDELVMRETIRRDLEYPNFYAEMMFSGFIDRETGRDIPTPFIYKRLQTVKEAMAELGQCEYLADSSDSDAAESQETDIDAKHGMSNQTSDISGAYSAGNGYVHGEDDWDAEGSEEEDTRWDEESDEDESLA